MSSRLVHRPRSHSVCASPIQEDTWSTAIKRAKPHHPFRNDFPTTQTWDVEAWSSGRKRVRRHIDLPVSLTNDDEPPSACTRRLATLPFTSAEFDFYPGRKRRTNPSSRPLPSSIDTSSLSTSGVHPPSENELKQLHSDAFWELRRSVAQNGEGFVRRMRNYEDHRSRSGAHKLRRRNTSRSRKTKTSPRTEAPVGSSDQDSEEDDIQIFGDAGSCAAEGGPRKRRALSLGLLNASDCIDLRRDICSSPITMCDSPSDDDNVSAHSKSLRTSPMTHVDAPARTPALSHTDSTSNNSSLVSLPLLNACQAGSSQSHSTRHSTPFSLCPPPSASASRSEKAIAALSLALANGAGGLNDYQALLEVQGGQARDVAEVGELWH